MSLSRCYSLMKCLLILFNIIFLCIGVGVCSFAAWALWDGHGSETGSGKAGLFAIAGWGAILTLGTISAIAGAVRGSASLLAASFALLALSVVAEGAAAWWGSAHLPQLRAALSDRLQHTVLLDYGVLPARTQVIDTIQSGLECCGASSPRDWQQSVWAVGAGTEPGTAALDLSVAAEPAYYYVPPSCCIDGAGPTCEVARRVPAASGGGAGLHSAGCGGRVLKALGDAARAPLLVAAALLVAHALSLLLALALTLRAHPTNNYKA